MDAPVGFSATEVKVGTVKSGPEPETPPTVTTTVPVVAPTGTGTTIAPGPQLEGTAGVPLKFTELAPRVAPKFVPVIVTAVPTGPEIGDRLVIDGAVDVTVKFAPSLDNPFTVTTTFPVVATTGIENTIRVLLQLVGMTVIPLNDTVLEP